MPDEVQFEFKNESGLEFTDISSEEWRVYSFPNDVHVNIHRPLKLHVAKSGGHRIFDAGGVSHYVPKGWVHLHWVAKKGKPNFVK